jgi:hypothetical protein
MSLLYLHAHYRVEFANSQTTKIHSTCLIPLNNLHARAIADAPVTRSTAHGYVPWPRGNNISELEALAEAAGVLSVPSPRGSDWAVWCPYLH